MSEHREVIKGWIEEAVKLRYSLELASYTDLIAPWLITEQLQNVRQRLDRIEELVILSVRARASLKRSHQQVKDELQVAWDSRLTDNSAVRRPVLTQEFVTGKEKFADANLATLELQRKERLASELVSFADESVEVIRQLHRGLDGIRQDLLTQVRSLQVETSLER